MSANFNFNRAILGGRLTADPEMKTTPSGTNVTTFTIAVNRKGGKDGQTQSDFIKCVAWEKSAEFICKYFGKGSSICIVGEIQVRPWKDKEGKNRYETEVKVNEVNFVDSKSDNSSASAPTYAPSAYKVPSFEASDPDDSLPF